MAPDFQMTAGDWAEVIGFLIAILSPFVALAVVLIWLYTPRRFSLRTLLLITTGVAVVLGFVVWLSR